MTLVVNFKALMWWLKADKNKILNYILYFLRIDKKLIINSGGKGTLLFRSCNLLLMLNHMKDNPAMSIEEPEDSDNINGFILYYGNFFR